MQTKSLSPDISTIFQKAISGASTIGLKGQFFNANDNYKGTQDRTALTQILSIHAPVMRRQFPAICRTLSHHLDSWGLFHHIEIHMGV